MPPQVATLALFILEELIKQSPQIAADIQALFTKADPTPDDWAALRARVEGKTYADFVPASALAAAAPSAHSLGNM